MYLNYIDSDKKNPWKDDGVKVRFGEFFPHCDLYWVGDVEIFFKDMKAHVRFLDEDAIMGTFIAARLVTDEGNPDGRSEAYINGRCLNLPKGRDSMGYSRRFGFLRDAEYFDIIFPEVCKESGLIEVVIEYTNEQLFKTLYESAHYIVDRDYDDEYYHDKEWDRRENK